MWLRSYPPFLMCGEIDICRRSPDLLSTQGRSQMSNYLTRVLFTVIAFTGIIYAQEVNPPGYPEDSFS